VTATTKIGTSQRGVVRKEIDCGGRKQSGQKIRKPKTTTTTSRRAVKRTVVHLRLS